MDTTNAKRGMEKNYFENTMQGFNGIQQMSNSANSAQKAQGLSALIQALGSMGV